MARYNVDKLLTEHTSDVTIGGGGGNTAGNGDGTYFVDWTNDYSVQEMSDGRTWILVPLPVCAKLVNFGKKNISLGGLDEERPIYAFVDRLVPAYRMNTRLEVPFGQIDKGLAWTDYYFKRNTDVLASPSIEAIMTTPEPTLKYWIINASLADQMMDYYHVEEYDMNPLDSNVLNALRFIKLYSTSEQMLSAVTPAMINYR